jgi:hypothetical protein
MLFLAPTGAIAAHSSPLGKLGTINAGSPVAFRFALRLAVKIQRRGNFANRELALERYVATCAFVGKRSRRNQ